MPWNPWVTEETYTAWEELGADGYEKVMAAIGDRPIDWEGDVGCVTLFTPGNYDDRLKVLDTASPYDKLAGADTDEKFLAAAKRDLERVLDAVELFADGTRGVMLRSGDVVSFEEWLAK